MRYAFIGDIHGNHDALLAVLGEIGRLSVDRVFCAGDLVGYGPEPAACIETVLQYDIACVAGNHDLAVTGRVSMEYFNDTARESAMWTRSHLSQDYVSFLDALPLRRDLDLFTLVHGAPAVPADFDYVLTAEDAEMAFASVNHSIAFMAHSHVPVAFVRHANQLKAFMMGSLLLPPGASALINVGSVGQPRDNNALAAFAIFDAAEAEIAVGRVRYDWEATARKIVAAGLPAVNAYRLLLGT